MIAKRSVTRTLNETERNEVMSSFKILKTFGPVDDKVGSHVELSIDRDWDNPSDINDLYTKASELRVGSSGRKEDDDYSADTDDEDVIWQAGVVSFSFLPCFCP